MKQEVVQDFLNLPGIAGIALMDGRSRPCFLGLDQSLNFQQKEALTQGLQQVLATTPEGFESFEFVFTAYTVHIYNLKQNTILMVLTTEQLERDRYQASLEQLYAVLHEDSSNAVSTFRLLAGSTTLSGQNYWGTRSGQPTSGFASESGTASGRSPRPDLPPPTDPAQPTIQTAIAALNVASEFARQFLGKSVVVNYWKMSRPAADWLQSIAIAADGTFAFTAHANLQATTPLTPEQLQTLQTWVAAFAKRCKMVIRDFLPLLEQQALDDQQKRILLKPAE